MFDLGATELLLIVVVAIVVIGPKDMPLALRTAGRWIGKLRRVSGHFRAGLDTMIREAEMEDMEKKWKAQNEKIMREHPQGGPHEMEPTGAYPAPASRKPAPAPPVEGTAEARARPQPGGETAAGGDKASSGDTGKPAPPAGESPSDSGKTG